MGPLVGNDVADEKPKAGWLTEKLLIITERGGCVGEASVSSGEVCGGAWHGKGGEVEETCSA